MKLSQLCSLIQDSIRSGRYPMETDTQKRFASSVIVANRSDPDASLDDARNAAVEVKVDELYVINSYVPNMKHLPGIIEADALDSFKMICRRIDRIDPGSNVQLRR